MRLKPVVLLGAGASVDAGVPASVALTEKILQRLSQPIYSHTGVRHAAHYAVGAMIAHATALGGDAFAGIDVESLFSAIQMLSNRQQSDAAPFVTWSPTLDELVPPTRFPAFFDSEIEKAVAPKRGSGSTIARLIQGGLSNAARGSESNIESQLRTEVEKIHGSGRDLAKTMRAAVSSVSTSTDDESLFRSVEREMIRALANLISVTEKQVDYLAPLLSLSKSRACIATLNYDRSVELVGSDDSMVCDTGIETWDGSHDWKWRGGTRVRLLKLHGSIDWTIRQETGRGGLTESRIEIIPPADGSNPDAFRPDPLIVFGQGSKLRAEGPFSAMLRAFDDMLREADHLVVVGYSFRDDHINVAIRRWVNQARGQKLTILDPSFDESSGPPFAVQLGHARAVFNYETQTTEPRLDLRVIRKTARDGLAEALAW